MIQIFSLSLFIAKDIDNETFVVCNVLHCNYFYEHFQAYNVTLASKLMCCSINNFDCARPTINCVTSSNLYFIPKS